MLRFAPDGTDVWSRHIEGVGRNVAQDDPYLAPAVVTGAAGDVYVAAISNGLLVTIGDVVVDCPNLDSCTAVAAFDSSGELDWLITLRRMVGVSMALIEGGPVISGLEQGLTALDARGAVRWAANQSSLDLSFTTGLASRGTEDFYLTGRARSSEPGCGVLERREASDGGILWQRALCDDTSAGAPLGAPVVLADGIVAVTMRRDDTFELAGFDTAGARTWSTPVAYVTKSAARGAGILLSARGIGPLAAVDADGQPEWQWPGSRSAGELQAHPSGLCDGSAIEAADGDIYVTSQACAPARALLGAELVADTQGTDFDRYRAEWLLARVGTDGLDDYQPRCGNGWIDPGEKCDGADFLGSQDERPGPVPSGMSCSMQGAGWQGRLGCSSDCQLVDFSGCTTTCGNARLDDEETCDGDLFRSTEVCADLGGGPGPIVCADCVVDYSNCAPR